MTMVKLIGLSLICYLSRYKTAVMFLCSLMKCSAESEQTSNKGQSGKGFP